MAQIAAFALAHFLAAAPAPQAATLDLAIERQRNERGTIHLCLSADPRHFPDCGDDPAAIMKTIPASTRRLRLEGIVPGHYSLTLFHDENGNRRLDMILGVPKEGFGFSRNPKIRFGAPRFEEVRFQLGQGLNRMNVRLQYIL